jgi:hypothetical protein
MPHPTLRPVRELTYGWFRRWRDARDARWDARADVAGNERPTPWLERNRHTFLERAASERLEIERDQHPTLERYRMVVARIESLEEAIAEADERLLQDAPTEEELTRRHSGEVELSAAAIRIRRTRELAPRTAGLRELRRAWVDELPRLRLERGNLIGAVEVAWRGLIDRVEQLQRFHARRQETYRRAYLRRVARRRELTLEDPVLAARELVAPAWAGEPCPWLRMRADQPEPVASR